MHHPLYLFLTRILELGENQSLKKAEQWRHLSIVSPVGLWVAWRNPWDIIPDEELPLPPNAKFTGKHSHNPAQLYDAALLLDVAASVLGSRETSLNQAAGGVAFLRQFHNLCF